MMVSTRRVAVVVVLALGCAVGSGAVSDQSVTTGFDQSQVSVESKTTTVVGIGITAPKGVGSIDLTVQSNSSRTVQPVAASVVGDPAVVSTNVSRDGSTLFIDAIGLNRSAGAATLVRVKIKGQRVGVAELSLTATSVADTVGRNYAVSTENETVVVSVTPPLSPSGADVETATETTQPTEDRSRTGGETVSWWLGRVLLVGLGIALLAVAVYRTRSGG